MPADPSPTNPHAGELLSDDVNCSKCGYSLAGLRLGGKCPECGTRFALGRKRSLLDDNLTDAPIPYVKTLAVGCWLMAGSAFVGVPSALMAVRSNKELLMGCTAFLALAWYVGTFIVTRPRQTLAVKRAELHAEWKRARRYVRASQLGWAFAAGAWCAEEIARSAAIATAITNGTAILTTPLMSDLHGISVLAYIFALSGLVPLALILASLADWAGNNSLADRFREATWGMAVGVLATSISTPMVLAFKAAPGPAAMLLWGVSAIGALAFLACGFLYLLCLAQLAGMSAWAISNSISAVERDRRIADRLAREADDMLARVDLVNAATAIPAERSRAAPRPPSRSTARIHALPPLAPPAAVPPRRAADEAYRPRTEGIEPYRIEGDQPGESHAS